MLLDRSALLTPLIDETLEIPVLHNMIRCVRANCQSTNLRKYEDGESICIDCGKIQSRTKSEV